MIIIHIPRGKKPYIKSVQRNHPEDLIIENMEEGMKLRPTPPKRILALLSTTAKTLQ